MSRSKKLEKNQIRISSLEHVDSNLPDEIVEKINYILDDPRYGLDTVINNQRAFIIPQVTYLYYSPEEKRTEYYPGYPAEIEYFLGFNVTFLDSDDNVLSEVWMENSDLHDEYLAKKRKFDDELYKIVLDQMRWYKESSFSKSLTDLLKRGDSLMKSKSHIEVDYYVPLYRILTSKLLPESNRLEKVATWLAKNGLRISNQVVKNTFKRANRTDLVDIFLKYEDIKVGDTVRSKMTGRFGEVVKIHWDDETVDVKWETGGLQPISKGSLQKIHSKKVERYDKSDFSQAQTELDNYESMIDRKKVERPKK